MWIVSLACSDIMFTMTTFLSHTLGQMNYKYYNDDDHKFNYNFSLFFMVYIGATSWYVFLGLNIDRAYAIKYPLRTLSKSRKSNLKAIMFCWVLALLPPLPYIWDTTLSVCAEHCDSCWVPVDNVSFRGPHL